MSVIDEIAAERKRQVKKEGWSLQHDDEHSDGSLAAAAACYAFVASLTDGARRAHSESRFEGFVSVIHTMWPSSWAWFYWKPKSRRSDLIRAAALIVAEIERLDRGRTARRQQ